eukprot:scaffold7970_cov118-Cylindrotheca_fusiformis.AAC.14
MAELWRQSFLNLSDDWHDPHIDEVLLSAQIRHLGRQQGNLIAVVDKVLPLIYGCQATVEILRHVQKYEQVSYDATGMCQWQKPTTSSGRHAQRVTPTVQYSSNACWMLVENFRPL